LPVWEGSKKRSGVDDFRGMGLSNFRYEKMREKMWSELPEN